MKLSNNLPNERLEEQLAALLETGETAPATAVVEDQAALRAPSRVGILFTFERLISVLLGLGILGCLAGFFLFVPALPAITVAVMLSGLLAMFWIGFHLGGRRVKC